MVDRRFGVIISGATGRIGATQHVANLLAIAAEGGLRLRNGDRLVPDVLLVGRDAGRLKELAGAHDGLRWHKSGRGFGRAGRHLHGLQRDRRPTRSCSSGYCGWEAHPYRKAHGALPLRKQCS